MAETQPRLPEVGEFVRGVGTLVRKEVVPPPPQPPPKTLWIFEEITAVMRVMLNGKQLTHGSTHNDFYGKGTSVTEIIKEAKAYCKQEKITARSDVEVIVVRIVETYAREPKRFTDQYDRANFYDKKFLSFEDCKDSDVPREWQGRQEPVETVVWSSRKPKVIHADD